MERFRAWGDSPAGDLDAGIAGSRTTPVQVEGVGGSGTLCGVFAARRMLVLGAVLVSVLVAWPGASARAETTYARTASCQGSSVVAPLIITLQAHCDAGPIACPAGADCFGQTEVTANSGFPFAAKVDGGAEVLALVGEVFQEPVTATCTQASDVTCHAVTGQTAIVGPGSIRGHCDAGASVTLTGVGVDCLLSVQVVVPGVAHLAFQNVPSDITSVATGAGGVAVSYTPPTATDDTGQSVPVTCSPQSGSTFAIGTTTVNCAATGTPASTGFRVTVQQATSTVLSSSASTSLAGQAVTFTATVSGPAGSTQTPTGTVTFSDGSSTLGTGTLDGSGTATLTTSSLGLGSHQITASYGGDGLDQGSQSNTVNEAIQQATSTVLSSSASTSLAGQAVTFTATVSGPAGSTQTPTGTVTFSDGSSTLGTGTLDGSGTATLTTSSLGVGSHQITAVYQGDGDDQGSTSSSLTQVVKARSTSTSVSCSPAPIAVGGTTSCTAVVSDTDAGTPLTPSGTLAFTSSDSTGMFSDPSSCTLAGTGASASCSVSYNPVTSASATITATYSGDSSHSGSSGTTAVISYQSFSGANASCSGYYLGSAQNVTVPAGGTCTLLSGTAISGNVTVQPGASLSCNGTSIGNNLQASKPAAIGVQDCKIGQNLQINGLSGQGPGSGGDSYICSSTIAQNLQVQGGAGGAGAIVIGDAPDCTGSTPGNTIGQNVQVQNNADPVDISNNTIDQNLQVQNNTGASTVSRNHAGHNAQCQNNAPAATGSGNTATGKNQGCPA